MNCNKCSELLSSYLDKKVKPDVKVNIENHLKDCEACSKEFEELKAIMEMLKGLPMKKLPEGFEDELHEKLIEASSQIKNTETKPKQKIIQLSDHIRRNVKRYSIGVAACLVLFVSYETLGSKSGYKMEMAMEAPAEVSMDMAYSGEAVESAPSLTIAGSDRGAFELEQKSYLEDADWKAANAPMADNEVMITATTAEVQDENLKIAKVDSSRKIIQTAYVSMDIEKYDETLDSIIEMTLKMGGYIEDMSSSFQYGYRTENPLKMGHVTIRVPQIQFHGVIKGLDDYGQITDQRLNSEDITHQYRDIASEVANLEVREAKLREIMDKAILIKDVLEVERELSRVRAQINNMKGTLIQWDQLVSLSRITINLYEVESLEVHIEPIDDSFVTRIREAFINSINDLVYSLENLSILLVALFPFIVGYSIVGFVGWKVIRKIIKAVKNWRN